jgi:hypothetical protein
VTTTVLRNKGEVTGSVRQPVDDRGESQVLSPDRLLASQWPRRRSIREMTIRPPSKTDQATGQSNALE